MNHFGMVKIKDVHFLMDAKMLNHQENFALPLLIRNAVFFILIKDIVQMICLLRMKAIVIIDQFIAMEIVKIRNFPVQLI